MVSRWGNGAVRFNWSTLLPTLCLPYQIAVWSGLLMKDMTAAFLSYKIAQLMSQVSPPNPPLSSKAKSDYQPSENWAVPQSSGRNCRVCSSLLQLLSRTSMGSTPWHYVVIYAQNKNPDEIPMYIWASYGSDTSKDVAFWEYVCKCVRQGSSS